MSKMNPKRPAYTLHKPTGQARVRLGGKDHYLGEFDSPNSHELYQKLVDHWLQNQEPIDKSSITIDRLCLEYLKFVDQHYRKNGKPTSEPNNIRIALRYLISAHGPQLARQFGPKALKDTREKMIEADCVRTSINRMIGRVKRLFRWGVGEELIGAEMLAALDAVCGLQRGRTPARESNPVMPVDQSEVKAVLPHVSNPVKSLIQLMLLTAARPGEIISMRGCDLNTEGSVWEYIPESHKTEHHGRNRIIFLGLKAQEIVRPFLTSDSEAYLFSPADAIREFQAARRANRKSPLTPSQLARQPKKRPNKAPGDRYTTTSLGQAIRKACIKAKIAPWHPNQLRHTAATEIRRRFGLEASQVILGHSQANVTQMYAERDFTKARQIIAELG